MKNVVRSPFALPTLSRLITPRFIPAGFPQVTALLAKVCRVMTSLPPKRKVSVLTEQRRAHTLRICSPRSYEPIGRVTPPRADFDSTRRRHSGDYALVSSIIPFLRSEYSLHKRSTTTVLLPSRLDRQVSLIEPSPVCKHSRKPFPEDALASSEVHPKVRLIPRTSCLPTTGLFHRQSGANCAFRSTAFRLDPFQSVPRRFLSRSFVLVGTGRSFFRSSSLSARPHGTRCFVARHPVPDVRLFKKASLQMTFS